MIKARVTAKPPIRHWSNAKGEGKLFSMDLMDESGQIRVTAFRDQVDKFYDMIEVNLEEDFLFDSISVHPLKWNSNLYFALCRWTKSTTFRKEL